MDPRVYLQVTVVLGRKPQLDATVAAYMSDRRIAGGVFHSNFQKPLVQWPLADLALISH
jgi:hypothetical protein